jgi:GxxExxY protein
VTVLIFEELSREIEEAGIAVHRELGPGLLESAYQACLRQEITLRGLAFQCGRPLPTSYKGIYLDCG